MAGSPSAKRLLRRFLEVADLRIDRALESGLTVVECPITFHERVGTGKGGNTSDLRALKVGCRMMIGIVFGWRRLGRIRCV